MMQHSSLMMGIALAIDNPGTLRRGVVDLSDMFTLIKKSAYQLSCLIT